MAARLRTQNTPLRRGSEGTSRVAADLECSGRRGNNVRIVQYCQETLPPLRGAVVSGFNYESTGPRWNPSWPGQSACLSPCCSSFLFGWSISRCLGKPGKGSLWRLACHTGLCPWVMSSSRHILTGQHSGDKRPFITNKKGMINSYGKLCSDCPNRESIPGYGNGSLAH